MQDDELKKGMDRDIPPYVDRNVYDEQVAEAIRKGRRHSFFRSALGNVRTHREQLEKIAGDITNPASSGARDKLDALHAYENRSLLRKLLDAILRR